ncbi:uncharacterized protein LOC108672605 [Hyalella azteca]|uniref:Uncharacterized protein LOC108672605 n=1 Tax=Hyalella azteca TaxID=294128 RepID=A0A8B7NQ36_HYAAZ|nr:uncharacterized protein LOC108672605 [Hyalella azteca]
MQNKVLIVLLCFEFGLSSGLSVYNRSSDSPLLGPRRPDHSSFSHLELHRPLFSASGAFQSANPSNSDVRPHLRRHQTWNRPRRSKLNQSMHTDQRRFRYRESSPGGAEITRLSTLSTSNVSSHRLRKNRKGLTEPIRLLRDRDDVYRDSELEDGTRNPRSANGTNRFHEVFINNVVLVSASSHQVIVITPEGQVKTERMEGQASHNVHPRALLNIRNFGGTHAATVVQSMSLGLFLCIDRSGHLYATCNYNRECEFLYNFEDTNYNSLQSYIYRRLFITVSQRGTIRRSKPHQGPLGMNQSFLPLSIPETKAREVLSIFYKENPTELQHCADYRGFVPSNAVKPLTITPTPRIRHKKRKRINVPQNTTGQVRLPNHPLGHGTTSVYHIRGRQQPTELPPLNRHRHPLPGYANVITSTTPPLYSVKISTTTISPSTTDSSSPRRKKKRCKTVECRRKRRKKRKEKIRQAYRSCMSLEQDRRRKCVLTQRKKFIRRKHRLNVHPHLRTTTPEPSVNIPTTITPSLVELPPTTPHSRAPSPNLLRNEVVSFHRNNDLFPPNSFSLSFSNRSQGRPSASSNGQQPFHRTPSWSPAQPRTPSGGGRRVPAPRRRLVARTRVLEGPKARQYENKSERHKRLRGRNLQQNQIQ